MSVKTVAIATVRARSIKASSPLSWLSEFLYLPEVLYLTILLWLFFSGPGRFSVDEMIFNASSTINSNEYGHETPRQFARRQAGPLSNR